MGCHQAELLERVDVLSRAAPGATLLLNTPRPAESDRLLIDLRRQPAHRPVDR